MKHIARNQIKSISANYQDGNFPASNLLDDRPRRKWSAGGVRTSATITATFESGVDALYIGGTNASEATAGAYDPNQMSLMSGLTLGPGITLGNAPITGLTVNATVREDIGAVWIDISPRIDRPCVVEVSFVSPGSQTLYAGVAFGGISTNYGAAGFRYGAGEQMADHSIVAENNDASRYYRKRSIARQFQLSAWMSRAQANEFFKTFRLYGAVPTAWQMFDGRGNSDDLIFGYAAISRTTDLPLYDNISVTITEAI